MKSSTPTQIQMIKFYPFLYHLFQFIEYPNFKCLPVQEVLIDANFLQEERKKKKKKGRKGKRQNGQPKKKATLQQKKRSPPKKEKENASSIDIY